MSDHSNVAIFWDYENCNPPSNSCGLGYDIVNNISRIARLFGSVTTFRAYLDISAQSSKSVVLRSELQSSGVSMIDCPHNGRKDVVDKMILVDMLAFAVDHPAPATIILITGDRDYAYAVSTLKLRKYQVILVVPSSPHTSPSLESQASLVIDWGAAALRSRTEAVSSTQAVRQPYFELDANLVTKLLKELHDCSLDDSDANMYPSTASANTLGLRRISARDLLEPSRYHKNTGSFDSVQQSTPTPGSPKKSTSIESDLVPGGLLVPKTPSGSRGASASTGSTRTRNTTSIAQPPLALEPVTPAKNPISSGARRSSVSDITDLVGPAKRSPSVLPLLDTFELPLQDSCPPSSIIVQSPLEPSQSVSVSGKPTPSSYYKLSCLASPFIANTTQTASQPIPSSYTRQSFTAARLTPPIAAPTKTPSETIPSVCETPQIKSTIGVPKEIECLTCLGIEDSDTDSGGSILHPIRPKEGSRDVPQTPEPNHHSYVTPHATYSPSSRNVGPHLTDTPSISSKYTSPAATPPGVGDGVNSQFAAFPRASNTQGPSASGSEPLPSPSTFPSIPFTTTGPHEHDESGWPQAWTMFEPLIHLLLAAQERGIARPSRSTVAFDLIQSGKQVYQRVGVSKFKDYTTLAERAGIIELGGREGAAWIALHPNWFGVATTHAPSNRVSSPTSDLPNAVQNSSLMGPKTPLIENTTIFQSTFTSPRFNSPENSDTLPSSPHATNREDGSPRAIVPVQFRPLIDILVRLHAEGLRQILRSVVGQHLSQDIYTQAGVSGFKEYVHQASEAQLIQFGGVGGHAWIRVHPELRI